MSNTPRRGPWRTWLRFWAGGRYRSPYSGLISYRRSWLGTVLVLAAASVIPLIVIAFVDYRVTKQAVEHEHDLRTLRLASNARRATSYFLEERLDALGFIVREVDSETLSQPEELAEVLANLIHGFGGFTDLGFIDDSGRQIAYVGPYDLTGREYGTQEWFTECVRSGAFVSDVYRGFRDVPHLVIAMKSPSSGDSFFVLRATVDTQSLIRNLGPYAPEDEGEVFLVNRSGIVQTPSRSFGEVLSKSWVDVPSFSASTQTVDASDPEGAPVSMGYAYIATKWTNTPFVLILVRHKADTLEFLSRYRAGRVVFVVSNVVIVLLVIMLTSAFLFNRLYDADTEKIRTLQRVEETSRLAAVGRLAAGVAHEINNPLAVIKETAAYMKDVTTLGDEPQSDPEFMSHIDAILESVNRCGTITRQLLGFARTPSVHPRAVKVGELIGDVLSFQQKEAEYRGIRIHVEIEEEVPEVVTDSGKLGQVLLNLISNAIQAMEDGGDLTISVRNQNPDTVSIDVADSGSGIAEADFPKLFEPFYTTKEEGHGTGLGLFITYGLLRRLGGQIKVRSTLGQGTTFTVIIPLRWAEESGYEGSVG